MTMTTTTELKIDNRLVGHGRPTFVIAEIGVNHDGSVQRAIELARIAKSCGADAVKLQVFRASMLLHSSSQFAEYQKQRGNAENPVEMLRRYELSAEEVQKVVRSIRDMRLVPLATPFSPPDMDTIAGLRLPAVKIASPDLVNRPLLARVAQYGKPMLVSTGAATMLEVDMAARWLREWNAKFSLLHCVSGYPTAAEDANLCWIGELASRFDVPIGYSDHTTESVTGALASAAGAVIVEKHLTYDRSAKGPDHAASADPVQFERYVRQIREAERMRGTPGKRVLDIEQDVRKVSRQSLVLRRDLRPGHILREDDLTVQRPGTGMPAAMIMQAVGRKVVRPLQAGALLQPDMLTGAA
jgi:N,N'-diacetyllegionaminate synthase